MQAKPIRAKILITVYTYPTPSKSHQETVCTGGITEDLEWVRLYPIQYRMLRKSQQFRKYQWIEVDLLPRENNSDFRKESFKPLLDTLEIVSDVIPADNAWRERRKIFDKLPSFTLNEIQERYIQDTTSLGIVKPQEIIDVVYIDEDQEWTPKQNAILNQASFFENKIPKLKKLPYKFQFVFKCNDDDKPHRAKITDWELGVLFLKEVERLGSNEAAAESVRNKYLKTVVNNNRDVSFIMGTVYPHNSWIVVGVFWPPKIDQLSFI